METTESQERITPKQEEFLLEVNISSFFGRKPLKFHLQVNSYNKEMGVNEGNNLNWIGTKKEKDK